MSGPESGWQRDSQRGCRGTTSYSNSGSKELQTELSAEFEVTQLTTPYMIHLFPHAYCALHRLQDAPSRPDMKFDRHRFQSCRSIRRNTSPTHSPARHQPQTLMRSHSANRCTEPCRSHHPRQPLPSTVSALSPRPLSSAQLSPSRRKMDRRGPHRVDIGPASTAPQAPGQWTCEPDATARLRRSV